MIKLTKIKAEPTAHAVELSVTQSGMVVSCAGGPFRYFGEDHILQPTEYTAQEVAYPVSVHGWLVKTKADGSPRLVVDENHDDGPFDWDESPFEKLDLLFQLYIPANTTTLDDIEIIVRHLVAPPQKEPRQLTPEQLAARVAAAEARQATRQAAADAKAAELERLKKEQQQRDDEYRAEQEALREDEPPAVRRVQ